MLNKSHHITEYFGISGRIPISVNLVLAVWLSSQILVFYAECPGIVSF